MTERKWLLIKSHQSILLMTGCFAFLAGFLFFGFLFGMVAHEESHAVMCLVFRFPIISFSLTHVSYLASSNDLENLLVRLAGGLGAALFSLLLFGGITMNERKTLLPVSKATRNSMMKKGVILGFEIALLTVTFHGVVNAIWEGLLYENYVLFYDNATVTAIILLPCIVVSLFIVSKRYQQLVRTVMQASK